MGGAQSTVGVGAGMAVGTGTSLVSDYLLKPVVEPVVKGALKFLGLERRWGPPNIKRDSISEAKHIWSYEMDHDFYILLIVGCAIFFGVGCALACRGRKRRVERDSLLPLFEEMAEKDIGREECSMEDHSSELSATNFFALSQTPVPA
ncbi:uncharacterized protein LY89DRAFT_676582 [Mollisia scopiformis]|uniref:Uncharacterized protein n=1 Tax=Mollisia scopiformis TaxID=149040 RepID=A0A132B9J3_MOLSC|nr:uncharacterized protein LY89DRAFT_676582 [Mollisia scopiformis]KUJ08669.1 hypothetical protein LY89DRAFT_676582 [Mollisia scopiformis]